MRFPMPVKLLGLDEDRVLVEQLRLLLGNMGTSLWLVLLTILLLLWALSDPGNKLDLGIWGAAVISIKFFGAWYARRNLAAGISPKRAHRLVWALMTLNALYGAAWGTLVWVTLDTASFAGGILVMAVLAGVTSNAISILSPVLPVSLAFCAFDLSVVAIKLGQMGNSAYNALAMAVILYVVMLVAEARQVAAAARSVIHLRFELEESHAQLREVEKREILSAERQRLMQDMHDGLGSSLIGALRIVEHGKGGEGEISQVLKSCIDDLKLAIDSMEPVDADLLLLLATLRFRLAPRLESTDIALRWNVQPVPRLDWLDPRNSLHILRILQEAFTNIIKHAQATEIHVATQAGSDHVLVTITDNGSGFSIEDALKRGGRGLSNQMRRAKAMGGEANWNSDGLGTCFTLRLPVKRQLAPV